MTNYWRSVRLITRHTGVSVARARKVWSVLAGDFGVSSYGSIRRNLDLVEGVVDELRPRRKERRAGVRLPEPLAAPSPTLPKGTVLEYTMTTAGGTPRKDGKRERRMGQASLALKIYGTVQFAMPESVAVDLFRRMVEQHVTDVRMSLDAIDWDKEGRGGHIDPFAASRALRDFRHAIRRRATVRIGVVS